MAIDFPNSPTNGQTFTVGTTTWQYDSATARWKIATPSTGTAGGDLTGTYPNPTLATAAVGTADIADGAVTQVKLADGAGGGGGVKYAYNTNTTDADPGDGQLRTNNSTVASTTQVFIDNLDGAGTTQTAWYDTFTASSSTTKGYLYIQNNAGATLILAVTGVTAATGYYKITCTYVSGARPADGTAIRVFFAPFGSTGAAGTNGTNGTFATAQTIDAKTGNYTVVSGDAGKVITMDSSSALTLTVNTSTALTAGQRVDIVQLGTGQVTVSASSVTINSTPGLKLRARYSGASLLCTASNTYILAGDLTN